MKELNNITKAIIENVDEKYKNFHSKLLKGQSNILGLRVPDAKAIAKTFANTDDGEKFLTALPHDYYDENLVHGLMLGYKKGNIFDYVESFIPFLDNWAVVDTMVAGLKSFFKEEDRFVYLLNYAMSSEEFTARFALVAMLDYYVDSHIDDIVELLPKIKSEAFYVKMAQAWLVSVMLVKRYEKSIVLLEEKRLSDWVHNKSIQKARESFRISDEKKEYLKSLKVR